MVNPAGEGVVLTLFPKFGINIVQIKSQSQKRGDIRKSGDDFGDSAGRKTQHNGEQRQNQLR